MLQFYTFVDIFGVPEVELDKAGYGVEGGADTADHVEAQVQRLQRRQVLYKTRVNQGIPYNAPFKNLLSMFFPPKKYELTKETRKIETNKNIYFQHFWII